MVGREHVQVILQILSIKVQTSEAEAKRKGIVAAGAKLFDQLTKFFDMRTEVTDAFFP